MEDRGGRIELLLPYATLEPIRKLLLQMFMGEKFGRDSIWETHLASELWATDIEMEAVMDDMVVPLSQVFDLKVGSRIVFNTTPHSEIEMRCGGVPLYRATMGRRGNRIAVQISEGIDRKERGNTAS